MKNTGLQRGEDCLCRFGIPVNKIPGTISEVAQQLIHVKFLRVLAGSKAGTPFKKAVEVG